MAKFSGAQSVKKAQEGRLAEVELPTESQVEGTTALQEEAPTPQPTSPLEKELAAYQPSPTQALEEEVAADVEQQEIERQRVPSLQERGAGEPRVDRWLKPPTPISSFASNSPDGNLRARAGKMAKASATGIGLGLSARTSAAAKEAEASGVTGPELSGVIEQETKGDLLSALSRVDAAVKLDDKGNYAPTPQYVSVASAVVENELGNALFTPTPEADPIAQAQDTIAVGPKAEAQPITHATGNNRLGQQIHQEYQRLQGVSVPEKLPRPEAETLGAAFKHLWADTNPTLVNRVIDPATGQFVYQLTAEGEAALKDGEADRKRLFPKQSVRPAKQPLRTGQLPGDVGQNVARKVSGGKGKQYLGNAIESAMINLAQVPNVVDKQRAKLLFSTILPVLRDGSHDTWQAGVNHMGQGKIQSFQATKNTLDRKGEGGDYSVEDNLAALVDKIAQEVRAVAQERNGANYLSYNVQGFQGRVTPQQSFFNPTTSKTVRFVTRNATPSIAKPGGRVEKNLRQMYAMMILPKALKADADLPIIRDQKLSENSNKLEAWGDRLLAANTMTDEQYEAISQAIEAGTPLTDPNFPQFPGLELDPEADAELIRHIESKGEDGLAVMDGLMDFAKYAKAKRAGRPHNTYFNAYMDGKTNGLASNGIQMGHVGTAERTGVLRKQRRTLLDEGDIRDNLKDVATASINDGWDGNTDGYESELNDVAAKVFNHRDLNKMTTMTFGYGKEIDSFSEDIGGTLDLLSELEGDDSTYHNSLAQIDKHMDRKELAKTILNKYSTALESVMSAEALEARALMRSAAALHSATNQLFKFKSPVGMDLVMGGSVSEGAEGADRSTYRIGTPEERQKATVLHYENTVSSAATRGDDVGGYAYGGSVVAPVQAMDAATVALSASGKSWNRLRNASGGNPYMHTIYDAFKVDANGYDVVLEEVNKNWLNTGMNWSYLEEAYEATHTAMKEYVQAINKRNPNETLTPIERSYMDAMLSVEKAASGKPYLRTLTSKLRRLNSYPGNEVWNAQDRFVDGMRKVGYNPYNPPANPTVAHLKQFVDILGKELNLRSRMTAAINRTNNNKKKLKQEILKRGYKTPSGERIALQYYAH